MNSVYQKLCEYIKSYPGGIAWRIRKHITVIEEHLNPEEEILFIFCGQKTVSAWDIFSTCVIAITNKRLMVAQKRVLFGYTFISITPDMYNDLTVNKGLFWGGINIDTIKENIIVNKLSKKALNLIETTITEYMIKEKQKYKLNQENTN